MKLWLLQRTDKNPEGYGGTGYNELEALVASAETEEQARKIVQKFAVKTFDSSETWRSDGFNVDRTKPLPTWTDPEFSKCKELIPDKAEVIIWDFCD